MTNTARGTYDRAVRVATCASVGVAAALLCACIPEPEGSRPQPHRVAMTRDAATHPGRTPTHRYRHAPDAGPPIIPDECTLPQGIATIQWLAPEVFPASQRSPALGPNFGPRSLRLGLSHNQFGGALYVVAGTGMPFATPAPDESPCVVAVYDGEPRRGRPVQRIDYHGLACIAADGSAQTCPGVEGLILARNDRPADGGLLLVIGADRIPTHAYFLTAPVEARATAAFETGDLIVVDNVMQGDESAGWIESQLVGMRRGELQPLLGALAGFRQSGDCSALGGLPADAGAAAGPCAWGPPGGIAAGDRPRHVQAVTRITREACNDRTNAGGCNYAAQEFAWVPEHLQFEPQGAPRIASVAGRVHPR